MLILSRKPGDAILIDGGIRVVVISADSGVVRLGIEAPSTVGIVREEIAREIADENVRAGATHEHRDWLVSLGEKDPEREAEVDPPALDGEVGDG
ncbi:MAG: carbon storage regulator [Gemmatimonadota bacterium]